MVGAHKQTEIDNIKSTIALKAYQTVWITNRK